MSDRDTLLELIEHYVEQDRVLNHHKTYHNRVEFETTGETVGVPPATLSVLADCGAQLASSGGNQFSARISPEE